MDYGLQSLDGLDGCSNLYHRRQDHSQDDSHHDHSQDDGDDDGNGRESPARHLVVTRALRQL